MIDESSGDVTFRTRSSWTWRSTRAAHAAIRADGVGDLWPTRPKCLPRACRTRAWPSARPSGRRRCSCRSRRTPTRGAGPPARSRSGRRTRVRRPRSRTCSGRPRRTPRRTCSRGCTSSSRGRRGRCRSSSAGRRWRPRHRRARVVVPGSCASRSPGAAGRPAAQSGTDRAVPLHVRGIDPSGTAGPASETSTDEPRNSSTTLRESADPLRVGLDLHPRLDLARASRREHPRTRDLDDADPADVDRREVLA